MFTFNLPGRPPEIFKEASRVLLFQNQEFTTLVAQRTLFISSMALSKICPIPFKQLENNHGGKLFNCWFSVSRLIK